MSSTQDMLNVKLNTTIPDDIESQMREDRKLRVVKHQVENLASLIHQREDKKVEIKNSHEFCIKLAVLLFMLTFAIPFVVADLYYAYTDTSCVHQQAGNLFVNLFSYLAVSGILGGSAMFIVTVLFLCTKKDTCLAILKSFPTLFITALASAFTLAWTVTGAIIFWNLIDNSVCDRGIYNYVFAQLIIKFIYIWFNIVQNKNKKNKK